MSEFLWFVDRRTLWLSSYLSGNLLVLTTVLHCLNSTTGSRLPYVIAIIFLPFGNLKNRKKLSFTLALKFCILNHLDGLCGFIHSPYEWVIIPAASLCFWIKITSKNKSRHTAQPQDSSDMQTVRLRIWLSDGRVNIIVLRKNIVCNFILSLFVTSLYFIVFLAEEEVEEQEPQPLTPITTRFISDSLTFDLNIQWSFFPRDIVTEGKGPVGLLKSFVLVFKLIPYVFLLFR